MHPNIWGTQFWLMIHLLAYMYPVEPSEEHRKRTAEFYSHFLKHMIPCPKCQQHIRENIREVNFIDVCSSQSSLFAWTIEIHNKVNEKIGKKQMKFDDANKLYAKLSVTDKGWKFVQKPKETKALSLEHLNSEYFNNKQNTKQSTTFTLPQLSHNLKYNITL